MIDWSRKESGALREVSAWRATASLSRTDFALVALGAGLVTAEEAEAWATGRELPSAVAEALESLPEAVRVPARIRALASTTVERAHPLIGVIASHLGLTDAQVDALFGGPASPGEPT